MSSFGFRESSRDVGLSASVFVRDPVEMVVDEMVCCFGTKDYEGCGHSECPALNAWSRTCRLVYDVSQFMVGGKVVYLWCADGPDSTRSESL